MRSTTLPVEVRVAEDEDLQPCLTLDDSYVATHTWQVEAVRGDVGTMSFQFNSSVSLGDSPFSVTFRPVRLPRARKIVGPIAASLKDDNEDALLSRLHSLRSADLVLIAYQGTKLCGYLALTVVPGPSIGWISSLVIASTMRQQGIGSMLIAAARRWARYEQSNHIRALMLETPTKNYPAIAFCRKQGFAFCGYTDYSFSNGDVVLLFVSPVVI